MLRRSPFLVVFVLAQLFCAFSAYAADADYELVITDNLRTAVYPDDMNWQKDTCWTNWHLWRFARRRPYFMLRNTVQASQGRSITKLRLRLPATSQYRFDRLLDFADTVSPNYTDFLERTLISPDTLEGGVTSLTLEISFAGRPIAPGEKYGFRAEIVRADGTYETLLDYQNVLWHQTGNNRQDNAYVQVTYSDGTVLPEVPLFEYRAEDKAQYDDPPTSTWGNTYVWFCGESGRPAGFNGRVFLAKSGIEGYSGTYYFRQKKAVCVSGQKQYEDCWTNNPGICEAGKRSRTCTSYGTWGTYGACVSTIMPGSRAEQCTNGLDDDCDGKVDGQDSNCFECVPGTTQQMSCSSGLPGVCSAGKKQRTCTANGWWGSYGSCQPDVTPGSRSEQCSNGLDDDCDGKVDGQDPNCFECVPGTTQQMSCSSGLPGVCSAGKKQRTCTAAGWWGSYGTCKPDVMPGTRSEQCTNGIDDDCDGFIDTQDSSCRECAPGAEETKPCATSYHGVCQWGQKRRICNQTGWWNAFSSCEALVLPGAKSEICNNGDDDDCDGKTDQSDSDCGECTPGVSEEQSCTTGLPGACGTGKEQRTCLPSGSWGGYGSCTPDALPGANKELCSNNIDDDCDGYVDDSADCIDCTPGEKESGACLTGLYGVCGNGTAYRYCSSSGVWSSYGACFPVSKPGALPESCGNASDDNCDGQIDEGCGPSPQGTPLTDSGKDLSETCLVDLVEVKQLLDLTELNAMATKSVKITKKRLKKVMSDGEAYAVAAGTCNELLSTMEDEYASGMALHGKLPDIGNKCLIGDSCSSVELSGDVQAISRVANRLFGSFRTSIKLYKQATGSKVAKVLALRRAARKLRKQLVQSTSSMPQRVYSCHALDES